MRIPFETDGGAGWRASLGLIVLRSDETMEGEFRRMLDLPGVAFHCARIECAAEISPQSLAAMRADLPRAAALLPSTGLAAVGFGCTSGATVIGEDETARLIRTAHPSARVGNPLTAAKTALRTLGVRRLAFVTPYAPAVSAAMRAALEGAGMTVAGFGSFEEADDRRVARVTPESCLKAIITTARLAECDGVFVACTNLRALGVIAAAERTLGMPVVSSNQALAWHLLRLAGIPDAPEGFGMLFGRREARASGGNAAGGN